MSEIATVRMVRDVASAAGGPTEADVHPDEVENFKAAGFELETEPSARKRKQPAPEKE